MRAKICRMNIRVRKRLTASSVLNTVKGRREGASIGAKA